MVEFADAIENATVRTFRVPGVGRVRVEIGDEVPRAVEYGRYVHEHTYPAYRVSVDGEVIMAGCDWGVPVATCTDDVDAMLALMFWLGEDGEAAYAEEIALWVGDRRELRAALSAPWAGTWRETVDEFRADRGW